MSDMPQNTGAFHNIYETTLEPDTTKSMLHEGANQEKALCSVLKSHQAFKLPITI